VLLALAGGRLAAAESPPFAPAILYDFGGKHDHAYNEAASAGVLRFERETGIRAREFEIATAAQREQILRQFARRGASIIVVVGFSQASAVEAVAPDFPATRFTLIDAVVDRPNVRSVTFREQEATFLCGMAAALASKSGRIGFIGGMDIPLVRKFGVGYEAGARYVNPRVQVLVNMVGTTPTAWSDPLLGAEIARGQLGRGADVIFQVAGGTGVGVMQAAADAGALSIGSDSNQDGLHPGRVLTSAIKRIDAIVYRSFVEARSGAWRGGIHELGLADDAVGYTQDDYNRAVLPPELVGRLEAARRAIIAGQIAVPDREAAPPGGG
jgi:basic membrane protein A